VRSLLRYAWTAFRWRWNLLAFSGAVVAALLSGRADMVLPLILALEAAYLGLVSANPRFRKAVDAASRAIPVAAPAPFGAEVVENIRKVLTPKEWERFQALRDRCAALTRIGHQLRGSDAGGLDDLRTDALDRLLWMFLKLLVSKNALDRFLTTVDAGELRLDIQQSERRVEEGRKAGRREGLIHAMEDKLETMRQRLANCQRAADNRETIVAELDRVEQKIAAVSEGSLTARDAEAIGAHVDGIAAGVTVADEAMQGLDVPLILGEERAPRFLKEKA
jgi:hypothetical protein